MKFYMILSILLSLLPNPLAAQNNIPRPSPETIKKNSVFVSCDFLLTFTINYERLFPVGRNVNLGLRGGFGADGGNNTLVAVGEGLFLYGKTKHIFEAGVGYQQPLHYLDEGPDSPLIAIMAGYRYQSLSGFLLKVYPEYIIEISPQEGSWGNFPFLGIALGYAF